MNSRSNETDGSIYTVNGQSYISLTYYQLNSLLAIIRLMHENIGCMLTSSHRNHTNFWDVGGNIKNIGHGIFCS